LFNTILNYCWSTRWARLRDPNYLSETDDATPMDYQIDQIVVHPDFQIPSLYNDIALFHLDRDVEFSSYVQPICLNADPNWQSSHSQTVIAPGWGRIENGWFTIIALKRTFSRAVLNKYGRRQGWALKS